MSSASPIRGNKTKEYLAHKLQSPVKFPPLFEDAANSNLHGNTVIDKSIFEVDLNEFYDYDTGSMEPLSMSQELKRHFDNSPKNRTSKRRRALSKEDSSFISSKTLKNLDGTYGLDSVSTRLPFLKQVFLTHPHSPTNTTVIKLDSSIQNLLREAKNNTPTSIHSQRSNVPGKYLSNEEELIGIKTGDDAIAFFSRAGEESAIKFVYLNRAPTKNDEYRPYDLVVTTREHINPEYFTMSSTGIVHIQPDHPSEYISVSNWMKESTMFGILRHMRVFKYYLVLKCFRLWYENVRFLKYKNKRAKLARQLFIVKQSFVSPLQKICTMVHNISNVKIMDVRPNTMAATHGISLINSLSSKRENTFRIDHFLDIQKNLRANAIHEFEMNIELIADIVSQLCESVTSRSRNQDINENIEAYLSGKPSDKDIKSAIPGKKSKSMVEIQNEMRQKDHALRKAQHESDMLGNFIQLVDYMVIESLIDLTKHTLNDFKSALEEKGSPLMFEIQMVFKEDVIKFQPNQDDIMLLLRHNSDEIIDTVNQVPRVLNLKRLNIYLESPDQYIIKGDEAYNETRKRIENMLCDDFKKAITYGKIFDGLKRWYDFSMNWNAEEYQIRKKNLQVFTADTANVNNSLNELYRLPVQQEIGILFIESRNLKNTLQPLMQQILEQIKASIITFLREKCSSLTIEFSNRIKSLKDRPVQLKHFADFLDNLNSVKEASRELLMESEEVEKTIELALRHRVAIGSKESVLVDQLKEVRKEFLAHIESAEEFKQSNIAYQTEVLEKHTTDINNELLSLLMNLRSSNFVDPYASAASILESLEMINETIQQVKKKTEMYTEFHKLFNSSKTREWPNLLGVQKQHLLRNNTWRCHEQFTRSREGWMATTLDKLNIPDLENMLQYYSSIVVQLLQEGVDDPVVKYMEGMVQLWQVRVPLILALCNPHLKPRHWEGMFKSMNIKEYPAPSGNGIGFTVSLLEMTGVFNHADLLLEWSRRASGEHEILTVLHRIETVWRDLEFTLKNYKDSDDIFLLGSIDNVIQQIDTDLQALQTARTSEFNTQYIQTSVDEWQEKLTLASRVIEEWLTFQKNWIFLEILYSNSNNGEDAIIKLSLNEENDDFDMIDSYFREIMYRTNLNRNVLAITLEEGILQDFMRYNARLEHIANRIPISHDDEYDDSEILPPPPSYGQMLAEKKQLRE